MESHVQLGSSDKREWLKNHTLSQEQVRQLILNKFERAKKSQQDLQTVKRLLGYTDWVLEWGNEVLAVHYNKQQTGGQLDEMLAITAEYK